jgi:type III pantothenate kinase
MTALLMDLGNTRWKMALAEGAGIAQLAVGTYDDQEGLRVAAMRAANGAIDGVWVASVVDPDAKRAVNSTLQECLGLGPREVLPTDPMPDLVSGYRKPEQLGIDRLLAMVAARARSQQALCVIDAGTAVTIDFIDPVGQHRGGFILPGRHMFRECLLANTSIPRDRQVDEMAILGRDTATAVSLAGRYAVTGIVERFIAGPHALFPGLEVHSYVGGGDADQILDLLPQPCTKLDDLVLRGLAVIAAGGES